MPGAVLDLDLDLGLDLDLESAHCSQLPCMNKPCTRTNYIHIVYVRVVSR